MFKKLLIITALVLSVSACSSSKKKGDAVGGIGTEDLSFDPRGSDSGQIVGLDTINFGYDQAVLSESAKTTLQQNAQWVKSRTGVSLQIEGHCDTRGSTEYNLALGERRANAVKSYLEGLGIASGRLNIISYGEERLLDEGDSDSAHARNRRANFVPISN